MLAVEAIRLGHAGAGSWTFAPRPQPRPSRRCANAGSTTCACASSQSTRRTATSAPCASSPPSWAARRTPPPPRICAASSCTWWTPAPAQRDVKMTNVAVPRKLPVILSPEEVGRLIAAAPNLKHQAAMSVAYGAGLRVSEVVSLKVGDIDGERMTLRVEQGKGRKDRYAMLSPVLLERLRAWWRLGHAQGKIRHGGWLFPGLGPTDHVTPRQLNRAVHLAAATAGIDKRITPHGLRHAFATHLLEQKVDIRVIQVLLGHKRLDTTTLYAAVATDLLRRVISPLDHTSAKPAGEPAPEPAPQPPAL